MRRLLLGAFLATATLTGPAADAACSWPAMFDADTTNIAFPDDNANYWLARYAATPATELVIRGTYSYARYFSFHIYDATQAPAGSLADHEIAPDLAGTNPFTTAGATHGTYTVRIVHGDRPSIPAPNTIYTGVSASELLIYRVYVGDDPASVEGSVPLPDISLRTADGAIEVGLQRCEPLPPSTGDAVNEAIASSSMPDEVPRVLPYPPAESPPRFVKFWSTAHAFARRAPGSLKDQTPRNGGYLSNQHINYLYALFSRSGGELFVLRAKAPTTPDTRGGEDVTSPRQLRYFSICQNETWSQRFVECLRDDELTVDDDGTFTVVISDPADRPANAENWIPWGGAYYDGNVIYRHMLPDASFEHAIQRVPYDDDPALAMGAYFPRAAYCTTQAFEAGGFDAC
jgi:hypothetical protein